MFGVKVVNVAVPAVGFDGWAAPYVTYKLFLRIACAFMSF